MTDLVELILDDNRLTGQLPIESLQQLTRLEVFLISINLLEGRIFDAVMKWPNIQWLGLEDLPLLEVAIPTEIGQLSSLRTFLIQGADPSLPTEIGLLQQLRIFHFTDPYHREEASHSNNNNTTATLPTEIGLLTELVELEFESDGAVSGTIPTGKHPPPPSFQKDCDIHGYRLPYSYPNPLPNDYEYQILLFVFCRDWSPHKFGKIGSRFQRFFRSATNDIGESWEVETGVLC